MRRDFDSNEADAVNGNTGALEQNRAKAGYPLTLALLKTSPGYEKGEQGLTTKVGKLPRWSACGLTFSPDGQVLAMSHRGEHGNAYKPGNVLLLAVPSGKILATLKGHQGVVICVAFSPNGRLLATGDIKGEIKIWQLPHRYAAE